MSDHIELSRYVKTIRRPLGEPELVQLGQAGIHTVIDTRDDDSVVRDGGLGPIAEADRLRARGIDYIRIPVGSGPLTEHALTQVREALETARRPILIHGGNDSRAGLLALAHTAVEAGLPGEHMAEAASSLDLAFDSDEERDRLVDYVDHLRARPDPFSRRHQDATRVTRLRPLLPEAQRTLRDEIQEDHERQFVLDEGKPPADHSDPAPGMAGSLGVQTGQQAAVPDPVGAHAATRSGVMPSSPRRLIPAELVPTPVVPTGVVVTHPPPLAHPAQNRVPIGALLAVLTLAVLALDRRLIVPLLAIAGAYAGRAVARRKAPAQVLPPRQPGLDREIADLEARLRRLAKVA